MALVFNNTTIAPSHTVRYNNTALASVKFGSTEVWKNVTQVYPGTAVQSLAANAGTYGAFYTHLEGNAANNLNSTVAYIPVNLTGFQTMTIGCNCQTQAALWSCAGIWLAAPSQWGIAYVTQYPYYTVSLADEATQMRYATRMHRVNNGGAFYSLTWDVSALSGTHYLAVGCYCTSGASWAHAEITSVTLV